VKRCSRCEVEKPLDEFHRSKAHAQGRAQRCKVCAIAVASGWYRDNKARKRAYDKQREADLVIRDRLRAASERWRRAHPDDKQADTNARRKRERKAQPAWVNTFFISEAYALARLRSKLTGVPHQVDHIIPLRSPTVCGLHVETNLRVVPAVVNIRKGNSMEYKGRK
jgi:hypothetical protein